VDQWFQYVCSPDFNNLVPTTVDARPGATPIPDVETIHVKLRGYLLASHFKKREDHDLHAELSATPDWNSDHLIVKVPPGQEYCAARKALWSLVVSDPAELSRQTKVLDTPVEVVVDGYIFLDYAGKRRHHTACKNPGSNNWCDRNGGRGIPQLNSPKQVRGCWELHPIFSVQAAH